MVSWRPRGERIEYDDLGLTASTNTAALLLSSTMGRDIVPEFLGAVVNIIIHILVNKVLC